MAKRNVDLVLRARDQASKRVRKVTSAVTGLTGALKGAVVAAGAFFGIRALTRFTRSVIQVASDTEEIGSKFAAVFKELTEEANEWALSFADSVGRSNLQVKSWLATLQDTFVPLGFARDKAKEMSEAMTELAVDIASFNNKADDDVIRDLQSAIVGNTETVRKYGIIITQTVLKQELINSGLAKGVKNATEQQKAQARLNLIIAGTADAQGDAVRTASSYANQVKRLKANMENLKVTIGNRILPTVNRFTTWLNDNWKVAETWSLKVVGFVTKVKDSFLNFVSFMRTGFTATMKRVWNGFLILLKAAFDSAVVLAVAAGRAIADGIDDGFREKINKRKGILGFVSRQILGDTRGEATGEEQEAAFTAAGGQIFTPSQVNLQAGLRSSKKLIEEEFTRLGTGTKFANLIRKEDVEKFRSFSVPDTAPSPSPFVQTGDIFRQATASIRARSIADREPGRQSLRRQFRSVPENKRTPELLQAILREMEKLNSPMPGQGRTPVLISTGT